MKKLFIISLIIFIITGYFSYKLDGDRTELEAWVRVSCYVSGVAMLGSYLLFVLFFYKSKK